MDAIKVSKLILYNDSRYIMIIFYLVIFKVLAQGSSPIDYLKSHIDRYIECKKSPSLSMCEYILTPVKPLKNHRGTSANEARSGPQKPVHRHFV